MAYLLSAWKKLAIAGVVSLSLAPFAQAAPEPEFTLAQDTPETSPENLLPDADIVTVASSIDDFSTLVTAIETADLVDALSAEGPFTVFAPTDEAFADLDALLADRYGIGLADLLEPDNRELLTDVLTYHVVPDAAIASGDIPNGLTEVDSLAGEPLVIDRDDSDISVADVPVTAFDVPATNGVIHVVDDVLLPPDVIAALDEMFLEEPMVSEETTDTTMTEETTPAPTTTTETMPAEPVRGLW